MKSRTTIGPDEVARREFKQLLEADVERTLDSMRDRKSGKLTLNSDDLFRVYPTYAAQFDQRFRLGPILYPVAKEFTDATFERLLKNKVTDEADTVVFTAGGSATGKSSILRKAGKKLGVAFIVDTTFSDPQRAIDQVEKALKAGFKVEIHYVFRNFKASVIGMIERALDPSSGRIVPIDDMARTHFGAQRAVLEALQRYSEDSRVSISMTENIGGGKPQQMDERGFARRLFRSVDVLQRMGQSVLDELQDSQRSTGTKAGKNYHSRREDLRFSQDFYEAARSQAQKGVIAARKNDA